MNDTDYIPGQRQTVDRARHPTLGEVTAVYDNGPAWFRADTGEIMPCSRISWGGWSAGPPERAYLVAITTDGRRVELETVRLAKGDRHRRAWHSMHGSGWLVNMLSRDVDRSMPMRFDPDEGKPFEFVATGWARGRPAAAMKAFGRMRRGGMSKTSKEDPEDAHWTTYPLTTGEAIAFRDYPPPSMPIDVANSARIPEQTELFGGSAR